MPRIKFTQPPVHPRPNRTKLHIIWIRGESVAAKGQHLTWCGRWVDKGTCVTVDQRERATCLTCQKYF